MFTLLDLLSATGGQLIGGNRQAVFHAISIDSRTTRPDDLFAAFRGGQVDGHRFVTQALASGASGTLIDHLLPDETWAQGAESGPAIVLCPDTGRALEDLARAWRRSHAVTVIGVTGSVGKTSTKEIISSLLAQRWSVLRSQANYNTEIGLPLTLMQLEAHQSMAVLEMGMHDIGDIRQLARIAEPDVGVVTNVHPTHLERLGTVERIREAKSELIQELPPNGLAILNADDLNVRSMASLARCESITYGLTEGAEVQAVDLRSDGLLGTTFTVCHGGEQHSARLRMPGRHFVPAALAAVAVAMRQGMSLAEAAEGLDSVEATVEGRLHPLAGIRGSTLLDDAYNASPASTVAALDVLAESTGRRVAVLGDMFELGAFEVEGHSVVGRRAATAVDWLVAVGPRARRIADAAEEHGLAESAITRVDDLEAALEVLGSRIGTGDTVLIKASHGMQFARIVEALQARGPLETNLDVAS